MGCQAAVASHMGLTSQLGLQVVAERSFVWRLAWMLAGAGSSATSSALRSPQSTTSTGRSFANG